MPQVVGFLIAVVLIVIVYTFVSTVVVPILVLYILLRGWEKSDELIKVIAIVVPIFSIAIFLLGSALDGDLRSNIDISTLIPFTK